MPIWQFRFPARREGHHLCHSGEISRPVGGLHGLLSSLAIIPEMVPPSEWFPLVFGEEMLEKRMRGITSQLMTKTDEAGRAALSAKRSPDQVRTT
jgi:hypothetical protein